ncbi:hypothetical protein QR680_013948 [Steinernema hermaphroditum]|uniref:Metalloendopeptidase n=1 Tax=Steinernema hermaphroditum TaxID=289476 RepID=A0AA39M3D6_9BILA|nr:hypothetical protein QR680_013948 [Steinernema hermaphroditum]
MYAGLSLSSLLLLPFLVPTLAIIGRNAIHDQNLPELVWPKDQPIQYTFTANFTDENKITVLQGLMGLEKKTCLTFKYVEQDSMNSTVNGTQPILLYVNSTTADHCYTTVGRNMSVAMQEINLNTAHCDFRTYIHETLHVLGIYHTQNRYDRDEHITFYENRTDPDWIPQHFKLSKNESKNYGVPYDFSSVMHYTPHEHIDSGLPNFVAKDPLYQSAIGKNILGAVHSDYLLVNRLYKCFDKCKGSGTVCQNDGFVNPNDCQKCICPFAFGGAFCEELPDTTDVSNIVSSYKYATDKWTDASLVTSDTAFEIWHIKASTGKHVEIEFLDVSPHANCGDSWPYLEVQLGNFLVGGYKFFCKAHLPKQVLISKGNLAVLTHVDFATGNDTTFTLRYRSVHVGKNGTNALSSIFVVLFSVMLWLVQE